MFETLFGADMPLAARLVIALVIVVALIGLTAWLVRRFGAERLGAGTTRGRQPRLAVIDAATVDGRRRLILIRRDNVEHLMMIGGPSDVVVEANIVRAAAAPREPQAPRPPVAGDTLPRAVPLGEDTLWPLQPEAPPRPEPAMRHEPASRPEPAPRPEPIQRAEPVQRTEYIQRAPRPPAPPPQPVAEDMQWTDEPELPPPPPPPRRPRQADPLAGLAEELSRTQAQAEQVSEPRAAPSETRVPVSEPRAPRPRAPRPPQPTQSQPLQPPQPAPPPAATADAQFNSPADQNLAEMAQRLEAALRRPAKPEEPRLAEPAPRAVPEPAHDDLAEEPPPPPRAPAEARQPRAEGRAPRAEPRPAPQKGSLYDSLEQEMASLLGRPNNKP
jgi:hypothetical protein